LFWRIYHIRLRGTGWPEGPDVEGLRLWGHGYVRRYFEGFTSGLWMKRYRCPDCEGVHTCRPEEFYRGFHYSIVSILLALLSKVTRNRWLRSVSRQAQQYWWRGFRFQASWRCNRRHPGLEALRELLRLGCVPATHGLQCEFLRL